MDQIWDRNPSKSEVIGRCGGDEKTEWPRKKRQMSNAKKTKNFSLICLKGEVTRNIINPSESPHQLLFHTTQYCFPNLPGDWAPDIVSTCLGAAMF